MSSILMLDHLGERTTARRIEAALEKVYREAKPHHARRRRTRRDG